MSERPTNLDDSKTRAYCASVGRDGVVCIFLFFFFYLFIYLFFYIFCLACNFSFFHLMTGVGQIQTEILSQRAVKSKTNEKSIHNFSDYSNIVYKRFTYT